MGSPCAGVDCGGEPIAFLQALQAHAAQDVLGLRELDLSVLDDLDVVAPGVAEVHRASRLDVHAGLLQPAPSRLLVVDSETEVAMRIGRLRTARRERDELVAHVDEGHAAAAAAQLELEDSPVERERFFDVAHFERDVVEADEAWAGHDFHATSAAYGNPAGFRPRRQMR
jgi:hypothetical protein